MATDSAPDSAPDSVADTATPTDTATAHAEGQLQSAIGQFRAGELGLAAQTCEALIRDIGLAAPPDADGLLAEVCYWAARCARRHDRPDDAMRLLYAGLAAARDAAAGRIDCLLRAELVHALSALGQNEEALEQADATMQRAAQLGDAVGQAAAQEALASIYWMTEDWALGLAAYRRACDQAIASGALELQVLATLGLAATEEGVAQIDQAAGRAAEAEAGFRRSIALQRDSGVLAARLGDLHLVMYSELNCGCSLHSLGALDEASAIFEGCLRNPRYAPVHGNALSMLGRIALDRGQPDTAIGRLQAALPLLEALHKPYPMLALLDVLVDAHEALGDPASALACMRRYHALFVKNASERARLRAQALGIKYETERAVAAAEAQRERADRLERSNLDLASQSARHARASLEDALTGIANRRRFDEALAAQLQAGDAAGSCSVALLDVDHFKQVNDRFSHLVGDQVLRRLGALLAAGCRRDDLAARYGGEEFVLLSRTPGHDDMRQVCERVRRAVEAEAWSAIEPGLSVTVSIGIAHQDEAGVQGASGSEALMALADRRLYAAKASGRNQVCDA